jgi:hypothetical protein
VHHGISYNRIIDMFIGILLDWPQWPIGSRDHIEMNDALISPKVQPFGGR